MIFKGVAALAMSVSLLSASSGVTQEQFDKVNPGMSRWRVQKIFHDKGERTVMYADEHHRVLTKVYAREGGGLDKIVYRSRLCHCGPYEGPYHVFEKEQLP